MTELDEPRQRSRRRRRKSSLSSTQRNWIIVLSVSAAVAVAITSSAEPTGHPVIDIIYKCAFVVLTILAGSRARRRSLVTAAGLTAIGSTTFMLAPPVIAFVIAAVLAWENRRDRVLGALIGALVGWSSLNLVWPTTTYATAILAAAAVVPLWISGYRVARSHNRRRIRIAVFGAIIVVMVGSVVAGLTVLMQRNVLTTAASTTIQAANAITASSTDDTTKKFATASRQFESSASATGAIWTHPARLVPMVAQNLDAVHHAAVAGADVTATAEEIATSVDYDELQLDGGGIDLEVLASFGPVVERAESVLAAVDRDIRSLDSPWILAPLARQLDDFADQTGPLREGAELASLAVNHAPAMLGASGTRRYLMLLGNPAETRDIGGHIGTFAELSATEGVLRVERVSTPYELTSPNRSVGGPELVDRSLLPPAMLEMNPTRFPQNWGSSPDMRVVAEVARQLYPQMPGGADLDGVLYADPYAFSAVLRLVGKITITAGEGQWATPVDIDSDNAVQFLTHDQFIFGETSEDPVKDLVDTALDRLTTQRLPSIRSMVNSFGPVIEEGRLQLVTFHDQDAELLTRTGMDQVFARPAGGDLLAVINRSGYPSKIDTYVHRRIDYRPRWNPTTGEVDAVVRIELANTAPTEGLAPLISLSPDGVDAGTSRTVLSVITPFNAVDATVDSEVVPIGTRPETDDLRRHSVLVDIPPGATKVIEFTLRGHVDPGSDYHLRYYGQPMVNPDVADVSITSTGSPFVGGANAGRAPISTAGSATDGGNTADGGGNAAAGRNASAGGNTGAGGAATAGGKTGKVADGATTGNDQGSGGDQVTGGGARTRDDQSTRRVTDLVFLTQK